MRAVLVAVDASCRESSDLPRRQEPPDGPGDAAGRVTGGFRPAGGKAGRKPVTDPIHNKENTMQPNIKWAYVVRVS
ncbi:hypothetical protein Ga0074812_120121 [Parafrankia irregularis]|uniref:Uncharacterized protein n=1 Tax=Parafrankia irregularis TaxID=795642 RepID=A0A0S4QUU8_9ACTN|nr:hypothetical protein Ga0074812_120121 [Parafrankia irregularis]